MLVRDGDGGQRVQLGKVRPFRARRLVPGVFFVHAKQKFVRLSRQFVCGLPVPPSLPEAAWINKPKVESKKVILAENVPIPGIVGDGSGVDRRSWDILDSDISNRAGQRHGNDIKFDSKVSQYHCHVPTASESCGSAHFE